MTMYLSLAWRNIWRNRNRTLITTASVFFAVTLVLFTRSMQLGTYAHIINNTVRLSTGYLQIQAKGFLEKKSIDKSFVLNNSLVNAITRVSHITKTVPRFEAYALASYGAQSRGASIQGIEPELENTMSGLSKYVKNGVYLDKESVGVLVGSKLAELLSIHVGDSLVLLGQGYHGQSAAGAYPVIGLVKLALPELDGRAVFMTLSQAQELYGAPGRATALAIMVDGPQNMEPAAQRIRRFLPSDLVVENWRELLPELVQSIELDNSSGMIMLGILYIIIAFGVFGAAMMMAAERRREFAVLVSIGMKRWKISLTVFLETIFIGLLGASLGAAFSVPLLLFFRAHPIHLSGQGAQAMLQYGFEPIMAFQVNTAMFMHQAIIVVVISMFSTLYPLWTVGRFRIVNALRA